MGTWVDGERLIRHGPGALDAAADLLSGRGFEDYALLTTERAQQAAPAVVERAAAVVHVPAGPVPRAAAAARPEVGARPVVALGGGRVVDSAKAVAAADGLACAAVPTTLSGAEMTPFHRLPEGVEGVRPVRPSLVIAEAALMTSQSAEQLAASAMNALAHALEALYTPLRNPAAELAAVEAARLIAAGVESSAGWEGLALGALLAGYASGSAGFAAHHAVCQTIVRTCATPHAETNAVMLPHFVRELGRRAEGIRSETDERAGAVGRFAGAIGARGAAEAAQRVAALSARCGRTRLAELGVEEGALADLAAASLAHPAYGNAPDAPDEKELIEILREAL